MKTNWSNSWVLYKTVYLHSVKGRTKYQQIKDIVGREISNTVGGWIVDGVWPSVWEPIGEPVYWGVREYGT